MSDPISSGSGNTPAKGRPTPKRREAQGRRGPIMPAPQTSKEARERRKALRPAKEDRKAEREKAKLAAASRRSKMLAGEEAYLLPRDKGPERGLVRDLVDARGSISGLFMPAAIVMILLTLVGNPAMQLIVTLGMLVVMLIIALEGLYVGRLVNKRVRERFPKTTQTGFRLGWYAFVRSTQMRRMRMPKPRVNRGDDV
ncbi:DUF3043 domain-containing protein [Smaragdicoccus niigatensis]|uniref:DUF3043 domain-containing protein n=1 Tax=Smaragdicoccus niigatensis TaxID=359359 RepID=UPI00036EB994|nr:DUF3043 domain-containing protein [Smaragdicoccus niigatensis]